MYSHLCHYAHQLSVTGGPFPNFVIILISSLLNSKLFCKLCVTERLLFPLFIFLVVEVM